MLEYKFYRAGFSLVELLVVLTIVSSLSLVLVFNLRSSKTNLTARHQISSVIIADLRRAQSLALSGVRYQGQLVCGYGIYRLDSDRYILYAGAPEGGGPTCAAANRNYQSGIDFVVDTIRVDNTYLAISGPVGGSFNDIFFESPDPKVYINNAQSLTSSADIYVVNQGEICSSANCTTLTVYGSGRIDFVN